MRIVPMVPHSPAARRAALQVRKPHQYANKQVRRSVLFTHGRLCWRVVPDSSAWVDRLIETTTSGKPLLSDMRPPNTTPQCRIAAHCRCRRSRPSFASGIYIRGGQPAQQDGSSCLSKMRRTMDYSPHEVQTQENALV